MSCVRFEVHVYKMFMLYVIISYLLRITYHFYWHIYKKVDKKIVHPPFKGHVITKGDSYLWNSNTKVPNHKFKFTTQNILNSTYRQVQRAESCMHVFPTKKLPMVPSGHMTVLRFTIGRLKALKVFFNKTYKYSTSLFNKLVNSQLFWKTNQTF